MQAKVEVNKKIIILHCCNGSTVESYQQNRETAAAIRLILHHNRKIRNYFQNVSMFVLSEDSHKKSTHEFKLRLDLKPQNNKRQGSKNNKNSTSYSGQQ